MTDVNVMHYIGIAVCILFSAFFSASEIAFSSANRMRLKNKSEKGNLPARFALYIVDHFDDTLSTILIGNNLVNILATSISTVIVINLVGERGTFLATLAITVIILIFGEITPKIIARNISFEFALFASFPIRIMMKVLSPVIKVVVAIVGVFSSKWKKEDEKKMTVEELATIIEYIEDDGVIDKEKSDLLQLTLEFSDIRVEEVITPRRNMTVIDIDEETDEIMNIILNTPFSRLPVYKDDIENIIGILHIGSLLEKLIDIGGDDYSNIDKMIMDLMQKPLYIPESQKLPETFNLLSKRNIPMALVVDEYGGITGCVTIEDIVEELVGEIWDEYDTVQDYIKEIGENIYEVSGDMSLREFSIELDIDRKLTESEYNSTVGGWLIERFGKLPDGGDSLTIGNIYVKILEADSFRVSKVLVRISDIMEEEI